MAQKIFLNREKCRTGFFNEYHFVIHLYIVEVDMWIS